MFLGWRLPICPGFGKFTLLWGVLRSVYQMFQDPSIRNEMTVKSQRLQTCGRENISISELPKALKYSNRCYEGENTFGWGQEWMIPFYLLQIILNTTFRSELSWESTVSLHPPTVIHRQDSRILLSHGRAQNKHPNPKLKAALCEWKHKNTTEQDTTGSGFTVKRLNSHNREYRKLSSWFVNNSDSSTATLWLRFKMLIM